MEAFWEKLLFWKKKKIKEGIDYKLYNYPDSDLTGIEILKGKYKGIGYYYRGVKIHEEGMFARLSFGYELTSYGNYDKIQLENDQKFITMMGDILTQLIETEQVYNEQNREHDLEEFDLY